MAGRTYVVQVPVTQGDEAKVDAGAVVLVDGHLTFFGHTANDATDVVAAFAPGCWEHVVKQTEG